MEKVEYIRHSNGHAFRIAPSSRPGLLNVALNTGARFFLGNVKSRAAAIDLIAARYGKNKLSSN